MDRFFASYVAAVAFALAASGGAMLLSDSNAVPCLAALAVGLPIGAEPDIRPDTMSRRFGLASFGRCCSLACSSMIVSGGVGLVLIACLASGGSCPCAGRLRDRPSGRRAPAALRLASRTLNLGGLERRGGSSLTAAVRRAVWIGGFRQHGP